MVPTQDKPNQVGMVVRLAEIPEDPTIPKRYKEYADIFLEEKVK